MAVVLVVVVALRPGSSGRSHETTTRRNNKSPLDGKQPGARYPGPAARWEPAASDRDFGGQSVWLGWDVRAYRSSNRSKYRKCPGHSYRGSYRLLAAGYRWCHQRSRVLGDASLGHGTFGPVLPFVTS